MSRPATGQLIVRRGKRGTSYGARVRVKGQRHYVTLGHSAEGMDERGAKAELANVLADIRREKWQAPALTKPPVSEDPTFHTFASEWFEQKKKEQLKERTLEDYEWSLTYHLLPYFADYRLSQITKRLVDAYKTHKAAEGILSANTINKTLTRLAQIMEAAVEYELIPANPAAGRRRRLKGTKPRRPWVEPEQLMSLLKAGESYLAGRGRPLLSVLAGAGLRIDEALSLQRRNVNLPRGTLMVADSKTEAGVRTVDLTPALRDELANWLSRVPDTSPTALVFPTLKGNKDNRQNVRTRLFIPAIAKANKRLVELGIEPIGAVSPHGLRRTFAAIRCAAGDDPAHTAKQIGHEDPTFTLRVYTDAVKRRERLIGAEREEFDRALEWAQWAQMGTNDASALVGSEVESAA